MPAAHEENVTQKCAISPGPTLVKQQPSIILQP